MKRTAAVAVVGGGVIGASVAYHLALNGMHDVVILDGSSGPGQGSTGRATGGFRAQFTTPVNIRLSLDSRERLLRFEEDTGASAGYDPVGYLWLAHDDRQLDTLRRARAIQQSCGLVEAVELSTDQVEDVNPHVALDDVIGAAFCPTDGYIAPAGILRGYLDAGRRLGVESVWDARVAAFDRNEAGVTRVRTSQGDIDAECVVNAAGPWAGPVAALAGVSLPITPLRRQAAVTEPVPSLSPRMPMTIFMDTGFHLRARDGRALLCWPTPDERREATASADDEWLESVAIMKKSRVPALRDIAFDRSRCYSGLYEMSPDQHAMIGFAAECANMFLVNGSSGHGVMHSPALGAIAADMICGKVPALDVHALRPSRFAENDPVEGLELL